MFLSCIGFGRGNLNDAMMEKITGIGNGNDPDPAPGLGSEASIAVRQVPIWPASFDAGMMMLIPGIAPLRQTCSCPRPATRCRFAPTLKPVSPFACNFAA